MNKLPTTDQFDWAPFQVFQFQIRPTAGSFTVTKTYTTAGGRNSKSNAGETHTYNYKREHYLGHKQRDDAFSGIYQSFKASKSGMIWNRAHLTPDTFTIAIGVTDLKAKHEEVGLEGESVGSISYELLFELLDAKGFSPLNELKVNRKKIENEIERGVMRTIKNAKGNELNKNNFVSLLEGIAQRWVCRVRDYIAGGKKPHLSDNTIVFREHKAERNHSLYPMGVEEPLVETGQLLNAIQACVFVTQSGEMKKYVSRMSAINKALKAKQRKSKYQEEKAAKKKTARQVRKEKEKEIIRKRAYKNASELMLAYFTGDLSTAALKKYEDILSKKLDVSVSASRRFETKADVALDSMRSFASEYRIYRNLIKEFMAKGRKATDVAFPEFGNEETIADWINRNKANLKTMQKTAIAARQFLSENGIITRDARYGVPNDIANMIARGDIPEDSFK